MIAAVDFETFYKEKKVSINIQGTWGYLNHPEFDAYLVSVVTDDGRSFVGHPEDFDWSCLDGATLLSHNASFDEAIYYHLRDQGRVDSITPEVWHCTADLCSYIGAPRSLKAACRLLLELEVSKEARDLMDGRKWGEISDEQKQQMEEYALRDSELCLQLWLQYQDRWPEDERELSRMTRAMASYGVCLDVEGMRTDEEKLKQLRIDIAAGLPWTQPGKCPAPLSSIALHEYVKSTGTELPMALKVEKGEKKMKVSFAKGAEEVIRWVEQNPVPGEVVKRLWSYRSANTLYRKFESMRLRIRGDTGRMNYTLSYCGAHTLRDTGGGGGVNMQNLPRGRVLEDAFRDAYSADDEDDSSYDTDGEEFGVSLRSRIIAPPGKVILAGDLAAIEPRTLSYLAGDFETLEIASRTSDWYEARARAWQLYFDPRPLKEGNPDLRAVIKQLEIGLGYGMGVEVYQKKTGVSLDQAYEAHANYRKWNPKVEQLWKALDRGLRNSVGGTFDLTLPSGRVLKFRGVQLDGHRLSFLRLTHAGYVRQAVHAGFATENLVQAVARDVYMDRVLAVARAGFRIIMRVHDEIVCEVDEDKADDAKKLLHSIMTVSPAWAQRLPLSAGVSYGRTYADAK